MFGLGITVRTKCTGNVFVGMGTIRSGFNFPSDAQGNVWSEAYLRSDGSTIQSVHVADIGSKSRSEIGQARAYLWQTRQQTITAAADVTPNVRNGAQIFISLTTDVKLHPPSDILGSGTNPDFDVGIEFEVIFFQSAMMGNKNVTFASGYDTSSGWTVNLAAGAYTRLRVTLVNDVFLATY
jgi:hypothetical protein